MTQTFMLIIFLLYKTGTDLDLDIYIAGANQCLLARRKRGERKISCLKILEGLYFQLQSFVFIRVSLGSHDNHVKNNNNNKNPSSAVNMLRKQAMLTRLALMSMYEQSLL